MEIYKSNNIPIYLKKYQFFTGKIFTSNSNNDFVECVITKQENFLLHEQCILLFLI